MIIVNLKGGLGNQMFQYALGKALALQNNDTLRLDTSTLSNAEELGNTYRPFSLSLYNIDASLASPFEIAKVKAKDSWYTPYLTKLSNRLVGDKTVTFSARYLEQKGDVYLDGYFQSPHYFQSIRSTLLSEYTLKTPFSVEVATLRQSMQQCTSVALHVRRGDYIKNPRVFKEHGICSLAYYQQALTLMQERFGNPHIYIFSDDVDWVIENLPITNSCTIVSNPTFSDAEELMLMSSAKHQIVANSSFSWWAAWLNQNLEKTVIAPKPWFDTVPYDTHLIPESWIQLAK